MYIPKHKIQPAYSYNIPYIYGFKADHLVLDNQVACLSLGKTNFPTRCIP